MPSARVVVFGYGRQALAALDTFERLGATPVAVVVPGNRLGPDVDLVSARAREKSWPLLVQPPRQALAPFLDAVRALQPDFLVVWSYSMLLPPELLALARKGALNLHGGLLPEYRGGHVMNWAIINGETESGATLHYLDAGIDTGPIVADQRFPIEWDDDIASIQLKLRAAGTALLTSWWPAIEQGTAPKTPQDETRARYYRMRTADDGRIDWTQSSKRIYDLVRALVAPWPGARTLIKNTTLVLRRVEPVDAGDRAHLPGTVVRLDADEMRIACGSGDVKVMSMEIDGRPATVEDLRRLGVAEGDRL